MGRAAQKKINNMFIGFYLIFIALLSLPMSKPHQIVFIFWSLTALLLYIAVSANRPENKWLSRSDSPVSSFLRFFVSLCLPISTILLILIRLIPFLKCKAIPTGFDTGYYRHYLAFKNVHPPKIPFYILDTSWLVRKILDFFRIIKLPPNISLFAIPTLFAIISLFGIYFIGKKIYSKPAGLAAAFLFAASPIQFLAFDYMLIKNIVGMSFLIWAIYVYLIIFSENNVPKSNFKFQKLNILLILLLLAIILSHRTTTFMAIPVFLITLVIIFLKKKVNKKKLLLNAALALAFLVLGVWINLSAIQTLAREILTKFQDLDPFIVKEGMFMSPQEYLPLAIPVIPFCVCGFFEKIRKKNFDIIFAFALICALWVVFQFIFYKRIIIFLDLAMILLAAPVIGEIIVKILPVPFYKGDNYKKNIYLYYFYIAIFISSTLFIGIKTSCNTAPEISQSELNEIKELAKAPQGSVLAISSSQSPWIYGWTNHRIIAPGLFENQWPYEVWNEFWNQNSPEWFQRKKELMALYNRGPLYIFTGNNAKLPELPEECMEKTGEMRWKWICK